MHKLTPDYVQKETYHRLNEEEISIIIENLGKRGFDVFKKIRFIKPVSLNNGESFDTWRLDEAALYCHYTELMSQLVLWIKKRIEETKDMKDCIKDIIEESLIEDGRVEVANIIKASKDFQDTVEKEYPGLMEDYSISRSGLKQLSRFPEKSIDA